MKRHSEADEQTAGSTKRPRKEKTAPIASVQSQKIIEGDDPVVTDDTEELPTRIFEQVTSPDFVTSYKLDLTGADIYYQPDFVTTETAEGWYTELEALETWYRPTLKVYGKSVVQSRAIAAYATTPSLTLKYSGQMVQMHHPYPAFLQDIQDQVEKALGVSFNHVMLNRYDDGSVYIGKHSDHIENKVIASLSIGAERTFIMSPRKGFTGPTRKWVLKNGSLVVMQGDTQKNWKHEIPKEPKIPGGRISLTFRQLVSS